MKGSMALTRELSVETMEMIIQVFQEGNPACWFSHSALSKMVRNGEQVD